MTVARRTRSSPLSGTTARPRHLLRAAIIVCAVLVASPAAARQVVAEIRSDAPAAMQAGRSYPSLVQIANNGPVPWTSSTPVRVAYRWWTANGRLIAEGPAKGLPRDVAPGESASMCESIAAPGRAGTLRLQWAVIGQAGAEVHAPPPDDGATRTVHIDGTAPLASALAIAGLAAFLLVTVGHFVLVAAWLWLFSPREGWNADDGAFAWIVVGLGSFLAVLNGVAFTVGLSFAPVLAGFAVAHGCAWAAWLARGRRRTTPATVRLDDEPGTPRLLAAVGGAIVLAIVVQWLIGAPRSLQVTGADAAHYHVPYAVNIALGANPFGLPATPHDYPMGTSVLAAWFILPFRDLLLVDVATLLPFLLAWFAIARLIRDLSGRSGLAWGPWAALLLFSTPMFRATLLMSADLFYAAAFLAVNAVLLRICARSRVERLDLVLLAFAAGMLVSTKVTGTFSLVALGGVYGLVLLWQRVVRRVRLEAAGVGLGSVGAALVLALAAGGIWLIRNWWCFGSPLAPNGLSLFGISIFPGAAYRDDMYHVSVLRDMREVANYRVGERFLYWLRQWFGAWFLASAALVVLFFVDLVRALRIGGAHAITARARSVFAIASAVLIAAHLALLVGVPWSSLEWTQGFALRYALPCFTLFALLAYLALFPLSVSPARLMAATRGGRSLLAGLGVLLAIAWYLGHQGAPGVPIAESAGRLTPLSILAVLAFAAAAAAFARTGRGARYVALGAIVACAVVGYAAYAAGQDRSARQSEEARFDAMAVCPDGSSGRLNTFNGTYFTLLEWERRTGTSCPARRIFTTARWDAPLDLQSPVLVNEVFDVRGPTVRSSMLRRARPGRPCDYVVATEAELMTMRGVPLLNLLKTRSNVRRVGAFGHFVVFTAW